MPSPKIPCPSCGQPMSPKAVMCRKCKPSYDRSEDHRIRMSAALVGRTHSYPSASTRPDVAEKIRQSWTPEKRESARQRGLALAADREWRDLIAASVMGELNPNHQGKGKATPYGPGWGRRHKDLIRERAGYRCEECGARPPYTLDVHHIDKSKDNHHPDNLQALCRPCHKRVHPK